MKLMTYETMKTQKNDIVNFCYLTLDYDPT